MYWFLSTQQGMSNGMIFVAGVLGIAVVYPICVILSRREQKAKESMIPIKVEASDTENK